VNEIWNWNEQVFQRHDCWGIYISGLIKTSDLPEFGSQQILCSRLYAGHYW